MNATLQWLKSIPELQESLFKYSGSSTSLGTSSSDGYAVQQARITGSLRDLYSQMNKTTEGFPPIMFLQTLRSVFPQFAQKTNEGYYSQQDAEECWSQIVNSLRASLKGTGEQLSFVDKFMVGKLLSRTTCDEEEAKEEPVESSSEFVKLDCHIDITTNFMRDGILAALTETIEKHSPSLGRDAKYTKTSRVSRLPKYLTVHFVRFFWRRDVNKKTKIMRKVKFPMELDATEFCTDDLRNILIPIRDKLREYTKTKEDIERSAKRRHLESKVTDEDVMKVDDPKAEGGKTEEEKSSKNEVETTITVESVTELIPKSLVDDEGANKSGLYDLAGVLTHSGASANSGHWQAWIKQPDGDKWWQFNDDKIREHDSIKISTLEGGGESDSAYLLLYKARDIK